jgi:PAS domain S-box-containing protein
MNYDTNSHQSRKEVGTTDSQPLSQQERSKITAHELENRLLMAMNAGRIFSWQINPATRELEWSENVESVIGFPLHDNIDKTFKLIHPDDLQATVERINEAIKTGSFYESEYRLVNPANNEEFWFHSQGAITLDTADRQPRFVGITQNITERKRSEEKLRELHERTSEILESISDAFYAVDSDFKFTYINKKAEELWERSRESLVGKHYWTEFPALLGRESYRMHHKALSERCAVHYETFARLIQRWIDVSIYPDARGGLAVYFRDITERKEAEKSIRFQAHLLNTVEQAVIATDLNGFVIFWNRFAEKLYGWMAEEVAGRNIMELTTPEVLADQAEDIMSLLRQGKSWSGEFIVQRRNGATFPAQVFNSPITDDKGTLIGVVGISVDITDRKKAEKILRDSEERLRLIMDSAEDYAIITTDTEGIINGFNPGAEKMFGFSAGEIVGRNFEILFTPEDRQKGVPAMERQTAAETGSSTDERLHIRKDGTRFYISGVMRPLKDAKIEGFVKIARDMTERIEAETVQRDKEILQGLVQAQEDERKRIARDLHDALGQQLTTLKLKLELIRRLRENDEQLLSMIDETQVIAKNIDEGVDFLAWELRPSVLDDLGLFAALDKYVKEWSHHSGVPAEFINSSKTLSRFATETETSLYRIVQEALNNTHKHARAQRVGVILDTRDESIILIIEDDGIGFNLENEKTRSKGLGLLGIQERVALLGGTIEIESAPEQGTTIYVRVPIAGIKDNSAQN